MRIIVGTGMPGSGKGLLTKAARTLGLPVIVLGDIVREKAKQWGVEPLEAGQRIRNELGLGGVALLALDIIKQKYPDAQTLYIDGVRSRHEIEVFKSLGDVVIVAVHASPKVRFKRLFKRGREDDPRTREEFVKRDEKEISRGIAKVIALADLVLENNGEDEDEAYARALQILKKALSWDP